MFDKNNIYFRQFINLQLNEINKLLEENLKLVISEKEKYKNIIIYSENMKIRNTLYIYYKRYSDYIL